VTQPGDTAQVTVYYSEPLPPNAVLYRYDQTREWHEAASAAISEDRMSVMLTIEDGGLTDADGAENGIIIDLFGIAIPPGPYTIAFSGDANGSVEGNLEQVLVAGERTTPVTAMANTGYRFVNWTGTGGFASTSNPLSLVALTDMEIMANFEVIPGGPFTVNFMAGANGTVEGESSQTVPAGGTTMPVTAVPASGYAFVNWTGTGGFVSTNNPVTVTNVAMDMAITANFKAVVEPVTVTFTAGDGGTVSGNLTQVISKGGSTTAVEAIAMSGYKFVKWTGTGDFESMDNPLTLTNVTSDMEIVAHFEEVVGTFTVKFKAGDNGAVEGDLTQTVSAGGNTTPVKALAITGYRFKNWTGTGGFTSTNNPLTVTNVTKDMEITANFEVIPSGGGGGSDNCFINSASGSAGSLGIVLMAMISLLSLFFLGKREK